MQAGDIDPNERQNRNIQLNVNFADNLEKVTKKKKKRSQKIASFKDFEFSFSQFYHQGEVIGKEREKMALN